MDTQDFEYAGFWARTGAALIDTLLVLLITVPVTASIYGWSYYTSEDMGLIAGPADLFVNWVAPALLVIGFWALKQATPGKMAISAKVVDARTGQPASTGQLVGRYFAYFLSTIPLGLGLIWIAFDKRKQGWHDKLAGTVVIKKANSSPEPVSFN